MGHAKRRLLPEIERAPDLATGRLPVTVADLDGFELVAHCDRCGGFHQVFPGTHDLHPRMRLVDLIGTLLCRARRDGRLCGGRPRRLLLSRAGSAIPGSYHHLSPQWTIEPSGIWIEDAALFWETSDFERRVD